MDLPAVHFLCMHSFHQRCLDENENVCPRCADEHRNFEQRQLALEENAQDHSEFFRQVRLIFQNSLWEFFFLNH